MATNKFTQKELINIIRQKRKELKRTPRLKDMDFPGRNTYINYFGSWRNALISAFGNNVTKYLYVPELSKEDVVKIILEKAKKHKRNLKASDFNAGIRNKIVKEYGSVSNALASLGLIPTKPEYTKEKLIEIIRNKAKELGKIPSANDMRKPSPTVFCKYFGSWNNALTEAGYEGEYQHAGKRYIKQELIDYLVQLNKELGRLPKTTDVKYPEIHAYYIRFKSFKDALRESGLIKE
jgi:hypothetical protein